MKEFEQRILDVMVFNNILPEKGIFEITESHLISYIDLYSEIFGEEKGKGLKTNREVKFARKLAGLTMLKLNLERGAKFNQIRAGIVYMISNPSFPNHVKIGMTLDVIDRLRQYQTYDPHRNFKIESYRFVLNRKDVERQLIHHPNAMREEGEWISKENSQKLFSKLIPV